MKPSEQTNDIHKIIDLSEKMLEKARQEHWDEVSEIEIQRKKLIKTFFENPVQVKSGKLVDGIRAILEKDREIVKLGAARRQEVRGALRKLNQGKTAIDVYKAAV